MLSFETLFFTAVYFVNNINFIILLVKPSYIFSLVFQSFFSANDWLTNQDVKPRIGTIDMQPVSSFVYMQCWQLLALCTSIFLPKLHILWLLKAHLHRNANEGYVYVYFYVFIKLGQ